MKLKSNAAAGPDCLPPIFFHKTAKTISYSLSVIFRTFLDLHELPSEWKISYISPKFKKGSPSDPTNYRPISLTCTLCKVFESIIATEIIDFLLKHNLINENQHGFLKKHSTCTNLLETLNDWTIHLSNHKSVVVAYIDFTRAFDSVSHSKLLNKLISYGISGNLLFWIQAFITNRSQCVRVGSTLSSSCLVSSGIPQGSVLGPLLFNFFCERYNRPSCRGVARVFGARGADFRLAPPPPTPKIICNSPNFAKSLKLFTKFGYLKTN